MYVYLKNVCIFEKYCVYTSFGAKMILVGEGTAWRKRALVGCGVNVISLVTCYKNTFIQTFVSLVFGVNCKFMFEPIGQTLFSF